MVTHRLPSDQYLRAYHTIDQLQGECLKVMIDMQ
jgi:hypothetical protein